MSFSPQVKAFGGFHTALLTWAQQYGAMFKFFVGRHLVVVINGNWLFARAVTRHAVASCTLNCVFCAFLRRKWNNQHNCIATTCRTRAQMPT